ncbi:MAG TPA: CPBP family intramembrane glutamic endopeptidase [Rubrobacter sp.]
MVLFSLLHLASTGATVVSTVVVGLEAGVLLSAAYVLTRRLWLAIGIHFAWDFSQDAIFGVTGGAKGVVVRAELSGPALLTGGISGIEGSVIALLACLMVGAYLLLRAGRKGNFLMPFWTRRQYAPLKHRGRQEARSPRDRQSVLMLEQGVECEDRPPSRGVGVQARLRSR